MIYVIKTGDYFKVGFTNDLEARISNYSTHNPDFELLKVYEGGVSLERFIHNGLQQYHHKLEWFKYYEGAIDDIEKLIIEQKGKVTEQDLKADYEPLVPTFVRTATDKEYTLAEYAEIKGMNNLQTDTYLKGLMREEKCFSLSGNKGVFYITDERAVYNFLNPISVNNG